MENNYKHLKAFLSDDFIIDNELGIAIVDGKEVYFSEYRLLDELPNGFFRYDVRHKDNSLVWATIEKKVSVNFVATIISDEEIELERHDYCIAGKHCEDYYHEIKDYEIAEYFDGNTCLIEED